MKAIADFVCSVGYIRQVLTIALVATIFLVSPFRTVAQSADHGSGLPVLILVRHADKAAEPADDPPLTPAGIKRAQDLATALRDAGVTAIVTTQMRRTRETAQPLAAILGLSPQVVTVGQRALVSNPNPGEALPPEAAVERSEYVKTLQTTLRGIASGVVLIVGHDWSGPGLIASLGGPQLPNICASVYDNLFVFTSVGGKANLIQAHYGASTPGLDCK